MSWELYSADSDIYNGYISPKIMLINPSFIKAASTAVMSLVDDMTLLYLQLC